MRNQYVHSKIERIIEHSEDMRSFVLDNIFPSEPGQFAMVWVPGLDEKPISLSGPDMISVRKLGPFTEELFRKKKGDYLDIRGPYGNHFPGGNGNVAIGGGCGIAPLAYLIDSNKASSVVLAGKTKSDLIFLEEISNKVENLVTVTEDGSHGQKGLVTDVKIPGASHHYIVCGPEIMMEKVGKKLIKEKVDPEHIYLSLERYMKCAVGICGNCSFSGYRVCADGPVFRYDQVKDLPDFVKKGRTRTGELVDL